MFNTRFWIMGTLSWLITGCVSLAPNYQPPELKLDPDWSLQKTADDASRHASNEDQRWWRQFQDPVLNRLVEGVLAQNLSVKITAERIMQARAQLGVASSYQYPQAKLAFEAGRQGGSEHSALTYTSRPFNDYQLGFDTFWELDLFGRVSNTRAAASWQLNAADASLADLQRVLSAEVAKVYVQYRVLQQRLLLAQQSVEIQRQTLRIVEALRRDGPATELDVQQAIAILADTQSLIPALKQQLQRVRNSLIQLLGIAPTAIEQWLPSAPAPIPQLVGDFAHGIPADILRRRPDVRRADFNARAAAAQVGIARAEQYPSIQLVGSLRLRSTTVLPNEASPTGSSDLGDLFGSDALSFRIGPSISLPLFDFGLRANQVKAAESQFQQALDAYRLTVWQAIEEVENADSQLVHTLQRVKFLQQSAAAYEKAQLIAQIQYREGESGFQSVLDTQRAVVLQQQNLASEQGNIALAQINLFKALGGSWWSDASEYLSTTEDATKQPLKSTSVSGDTDGSN